MNRKAAMDIILMIGTIVIAAIILGVGASKMIMPLLKNTPLFTVEEARMTMNTLYAAPDDMSVKFRADVPRGCSQIKFDLDKAKNNFDEDASCDPDSPPKTSSSYVVSANYAPSADETSWKVKTGVLLYLKMEKKYDNGLDASSLSVKK